jgi:hypothetical protein
MNTPLTGSKMSKSTSAMAAMIKAAKDKKEKAGITPQPAPKPTPK